MSSSKVVKRKTYEKFIEIKKQYLEKKYIKKFIKSNDMNELIKYVNNSSEKLLILINKYDLKITQFIVDLFKYETWFVEIFIKFASEEIILNNQELFNAFLISDIKIDRDISKFNNFELIKKFFQYEKKSKLSLDEQKILLTYPELINEKTLITATLPELIFYLLDKKIYIDKIELSETIFKKSIYSIDSVIDYAIDRKIFINTTQLSLEHMKKYCEIGYEEDIKKLLSSYAFSFKLSEDVEYLKFALDHDVKLSSIPSCFFEDSLFLDEKYEKNLFESFTDYFSNSYIPFEFVKKHAKKFNKIKKLSPFMFLYSNNELDEKVIELINSGFYNIIDLVEQDKLSKEIFELAIDKGYANIDMIIYKYRDLINQELLIKIINNNYDNIINVKYEIKQYLGNLDEIFHDEIFEITKRKFLLGESCKVVVSFEDYFNDEKFFKQLLLKDASSVSNFLKSFYIDKLNNDLLEYIKNNFDEIKFDVIPEIYIYEILKDEYFINKAIENGYTTNYLLNFNNIYYTYKITPSNVFKSNLYINNDNLEIYFDSIDKGIIPSNQFINWLIEQNDVICKKYIVKIFDIDYYSIPFQYLCLNPIIENRDLLKEYIKRKDSNYEYMINYMIINKVDKKYFFEIMIKCNVLNLNIKEDLLNYLGDISNYLKELIEKSPINLNLADENYIKNNKEQIKRLMLEDKILINNINNEYVKKYIYQWLNEDFDFFTRVLSKNNSYLGYISIKNLENNKIFLKYFDFNCYVNDELKSCLLNNYDFIKQYLIIEGYNCKLMIYDVSLEMLEKYPIILENISLNMFNYYGKGILTYFSNNEELLKNLLIDSKGLAFEKFVGVVSYEKLHFIFDEAVKCGYRINSETNEEVLKLDFVIEYIKENTYLINQIECKIPLELAKFIKSKNLSYYPKDMYISHSELLSEEDFKKTDTLCFSLDKISSINSISFEAREDITYEEIKKYPNLLLSYIQNRSINLNVRYGLSNDIPMIKFLLEQGQEYILNIINLEVILSDETLKSYFTCRNIYNFQQKNLKLLTDISIINAFIDNGGSQIIDYLNDDILIDLSNGVLKKAFMKGYNLHEDSKKIMFKDLKIINFIISNDFKQEIEYLFDRMSLDLFLNENYNFFDICMSKKIFTNKLLTKNILNNKKYLTQLINNGMINCEILQNIDLNLLDNELIEQIADIIPKIKIYFSEPFQLLENPIIAKKIFENDIEEYIKGAKRTQFTEEMLLQIMLDGLNNYAKQYDLEDLLLNPVVENFEKASKLGLKTNLNNQNISYVDYLFKYNLVKDYFKIFDLLDSIEAMEYILKYNIPINENAYQSRVLNFFYPNKIIKKIIENGNLDTIVFSKTLLINCLGTEKIKKELEENPQLNDYINKFINETEFNELFEILCNLSLVNNKEDIYKYYNDGEYTEELIKLSLINRDLFRICFLSTAKIIDNIENNKYNLSKSIINYIDFMQNYKINNIFNYIEKMEDINKYFDENGITRNLVDIFLYDEDLIKFIGNCIKLEKMPFNLIEKQYVKFVLNNGYDITNYIFNYNNLKKYFDENGLTAEGLKLCLYESKLVSVIFKEENLEQFNLNLVEKKYIKFIIKNGYAITNYIFNEENINKYFDENGLTKEGVHLCLYNPDLVESTFKGEDIEKFNLKPVEKIYVNFILKNGYTISNYIRDEKVLITYFDENGLTKEGLKCCVQNYEILSNIKQFENIDEFIPGSVEKQYIKFILKNGTNIVEYIVDDEALNKYFDENGISKLTYELMIDDLKLAKIVINGDEDWKSKVRTSEIENLELIDIYSTLFEKLESSNEIRKKVFKKEFFDKLKSNKYLKEINIETFVINNIKNLDILFGELSSASLIKLSLDKELFKTIVKDMCLNINDEQLDNIYLYKENLNENCLKLLLNEKCLNNLKLFDSFKIIKYNLNRESLISFFKILNDDTLTYLLSSLYYNLKEYSSDKLGNGTRFIICLSDALINNTELLKKINEELILGNEDSKFILNILKLIYGKKSFGDIEEIKTKKIVNINTENMDTEINLKNQILLNLIGIDYEEYETLLERNIDLETLDKIKIKIETKLKMLYSNSKENVDEIVYLEENLEELIIFRELIKSLLDTISSTHDVEQLRKILINIENNPDKFINIQNFSLNIYERIRQLYELDAQLTLTRIDYVKKNIEMNEEIKKKVLKTSIIYGVQYYDLSEFEYALYAHTDPDIESLFEFSFKGNSVLCVTPVSDRGLKGFYSGSIIYGYDRIVTGGYIASSSANTGSNGEFNNNIEIPIDFLNQRYDQKEIKESSSIYLFNLSHHSETNIVRDGMFPCCIIIRGDEPSFKEIEAAKELAILLGLPEGSVAPMVKLQKINTKIDVDKLNYFDFSIYAHMDGENLEQVFESTKVRKVSEEILFYMSVYNQLKEETIRHLRAVKLRTGASHNIYKCKIGDIDYFVKPAFDGEHRAYAVLTGSRMQELINPKNAVKVYVEKVKISGHEILCSIAEEKKDVNNFGTVDEGGYFPKLTEEQIEGFLREMIVDHLIFNYDTKGANFIYDKKNVYGIDKEQAMKHANSQPYNEEGIIPTRQSGGGVPIYDVFLRTYINLIDKEKIINIYLDIIEKIESISLIEYFKMYEEYLLLEELPNSKIIPIIKRRLNLVNDIKSFVSKYFNIDIEYMEKDLSEEINELVEYLNTKGVYLEGELVEKVR